MLIGDVVVAALVYIKFKSKVLLVWFASILGYVFFSWLALLLMTSIGDCRGGECAGTVVLGTLLYLLAPASMLFCWQDMLYMQMSDRKNNPAWCGMHLH